ncbi:MAG: DUF3137 domain-containing protein [Flavobacterium sp.]|nr:DUF3137 domain-containing protein [Flavobacterium sp.]
MPNNINHDFDSEKFNQILEQLENSRKIDSGTVTANQKQNSKLQRNNFLSVLGIGGGFAIGCAVAFVSAIISLLLCIIFQSFLFMAIPVIVGAAAFLGPMAFGMKHVIKNTDKISHLSAVNEEMQINYRMSVKEQLISQIVKSFNSTFDYQPKNKIPSKEFHRMNVYKGSLQSDYGGEDYITGKVGTTNLEMCEFYAGVSGLFMIADFNKNFRGTTKVMTRIWEKRSLDVPELLDGNIEIKYEGNGRIYRKDRNSFANIALEEVILENTAFNQKFETVASDQIEARYILSTSFMERILAFRRRYNYDMNFVFNDSKMYFTVLWGAHMLEPFDINVDLKEAKLQLIATTHQQLKDCVAIIEALNINNELWYSR